MNRIIKLNNFVNPISTKEIKINTLYAGKKNIPSANNAKKCRYCFEEDDKEYISPCLCKGGSKHIHIDCLNQWRERNNDNHNKKNSCEICKYKYKFINGDTIDYKIYLININKYYLIHIFTTWFIAMMIIWIEFFSNFFLIRTLNFYNDNNSSLLIIFRDINLNEEMFYLSYTLFYLPFSFFLFETCYMFYFHFKCYKLFTNNRYKLNCYKNRYYFQSFLFLYYYYFCLILDTPFVYIYSSIFLSVFNLIYRSNFYKKHNKDILNIICHNEDTENILSFEDNPLLGVNFSEMGEKKDSNDLPGALVPISYYSNSSNGDIYNENKIMDIISID